MRKILLSFFVSVSTCCFAQNDEFRKAYEDFRNQAKREYVDFRNKANQEYAEFVRKAWQEHKTLPAMPKPIDEKVKPILIKEEDKNKEKEDNPVVIDEVIDVPSPQPQPKPVAPIHEQPTPNEDYMTFVLYGTEMKVRVEESMRFHLQKLNEASIAKAWERLAKDDFNNLIRDCLENRIRYQLSDWAYLQMLDVLSCSFLGKGTNEAELLKAFLYCQSGYQMRLAIAGNRLCMLYASKHRIFEKPYWNIDNTFFYADNIKNDRIQVCNAVFPNEQALSLYVTQDQLFAAKPSKERIIMSEDVNWLKVTVSENENLIAFCNDYPTSHIGDDFMTRWAMYANTPLSNSAKQQLYPQFKKIFTTVIENMKQQGVDEASFTPACVDMLCHWIQTGFVYEYDDKVWGGDRAFFADETLFYPYCDCEDRSILLTRLVRDLLGLKCVLVYYPGHLATAIAIGENIKGDFIRINGTKFLVCDPTYIGASIGKTMPDMDNKSAKVIVLN